MSDDYIKGKSTDELLDMLVGTAAPGSRVHEQIKAAILVNLARELVDGSARRAVISAWIAGISAAAAVGSMAAAFLK